MYKKIIINQDNIKAGQMNNVPFIISTKDLAYIHDMLNWNITTIKTYNFFLDKIADEKIQKQLKKIITTHKSHYRLLLNILK